MGIIFLERLLRTTDVESIYMLIRPKKGKSPNERIKDTLNNSVSLIFNKHFKKITNSSSYFLSSSTR